MNNSFKVRLAEPSDYAAMLEIYKPYVTNTAITFEYEVPSIAEYSNRIQHVCSHYPCIVCELNGELIGFAYAGLFRVKTAYQWSAESTIYVSDKFHGKGIARVLYDALLSILELQGFVNVYGAVTIPNPKSERFHTAMGFAEIGLFEKIGFKLGKWHDLKWYEMYLVEHPANPVAPLPIAEVKSTQQFNEIITRANEVLNSVEE